MIYPDTAGGRPVRIEVLDQLNPPLPPGCVKPRAGVPWDRSDDVTSTWQYWSLPIVTIAAAVFLLVSLVRGRTPAPGMAVAGFASLLWIVLWLH
jgi:hypothetical protein